MLCLICYLCLPRKTFVLISRYMAKSECSQFHRILCERWPQHRVFVLLCGCTLIRVSQLCHQALSFPSPLRDLGFELSRFAGDAGSPLELKIKRFNYSYFMSPCAGNKVQDCVKWVLNLLPDGNSLSVEFIANWKQINYFVIFKFIGGSAQTNPLL